MEMHNVQSEGIVHLVEIKNDKIDDQVIILIDHPDVKRVYLRLTPERKNIFDKALKNSYTTLEEIYALEGIKNFGFHDYIDITLLCTCLSNDL